MKAEIKLGTLCNNNCVFCLNDPEKRWDKTTEQVKQEILFFKQKSVKNIQFTGGEPTIRNDFFELLDFTRKQGLNITIQTNGRAFAYDWFVEKTTAFGISLFLISLHAHEKKLYKELSSVDGYEQTIQGIRNLKRRNQTININVVVNSKNIASLPEIAEHHSQLDAETIQFGWARPEGKSAKDTGIVPNYTQNKKSLFEAADILASKGKNVAIIGVPYCLLGEYKKYVGRPYKDSIIKEGTNPEEMFNHEKKVRLNKCSKCPDLNVCGGVFKKYLEKFGQEEFVNF